MMMVAIDLGKFKSYILIEDESGKIVFDRKVDTKRAALSAVFGLLKPCRVLIEASTSSEWVARLLESFGHTVIVADPNFGPMYARKDKSQKTDRRDALALLEALKLNAFRVAVRRSDDEMFIRATLAARDKLVKNRTSLVNLVRALTQRFGVEIEKVAESKNYADAVRRDCSVDELLEGLEPLLCALDALSEQIRRYDEKLEERAAQNDVARRLQQIPGVGPLVSLAFVYALSDVGRFAKADKVAAYLGLVPSVTASGETEIRGGITKRGDHVTRALLNEAALGIMGSRNPRVKWLRDWALELKARKGKKRGGGSVARTALARRLARIMFAMWRDGTDFAPDRTANRLRLAELDQEAA